MWAPSLSVVGAPKRLNLFRLVKCNCCHLLSNPDVHLGSSRRRPTKSCCAQNLQTVKLPSMTFVLFHFPSNPHTGQCKSTPSSPHQIMSGKVCVVKHMPYQRAVQRLSRIKIKNCFAEWSCHDFIVLACTLQADDSCRWHAGHGLPFHHKYHCLTMWIKPVAAICGQEKAGRV